jgi:hypothetical protein
MPRLRDKNRFQKQYPVRRLEPQYETVVDANELKVVETANLTFTNEETKTYVFGQGYSSTPIVVATPLSTTLTGEETASVNLYISTVSSTQVTIAASAPFTGKASLLIVSV